MPLKKPYLTVSKLNTEIKNLVEVNLSNLWVKGEISNYHLHPSSGHMYFTLKDANGEIKCVMFRGNNNSIKFIPDNGIQVLINCSVTIFEQRGQIQLRVFQMKPEGDGDLYLAFEKLKLKLLSENLFEQYQKKNIPKYPKVIGVVTSGTSAAFKDVCNVINRRAPHVKILLRSVIVQGNNASRTIIEGIEDFNRYKNIDVIILCRGGGSIEDLWCFNEELVARSIFVSKIPIVTGVGHETDFTISDFVSDLRAPTPSAAAELVVPEQEHLLRILDQMQEHLYKSVKKSLEKNMLKVDYLDEKVRYLQPKKRIEAQVNKIIELQKKMCSQIKIHHQNKKIELTSVYKQFNGLSPSRVLDRGYSILFSKNNKVVRKSTDIQMGELFKAQTANGSLFAKKTKNL